MDSTKVRLGPAVLGGRPAGRPPTIQRVETIDKRRRQTEREAVFDWRFAELRRSGVPPNAAWILASEREIDIRQAERLFAQGCPAETLLEILL